MLSIDLGSGGPLRRRTLLRIGSSAAAILTASGLPWLEASSLLDAQRLRDRSVIFLFMHGGPSQYETFDPKMEAPSHIRSATGAIATKIPGIYFGSTFHQLAQRADLFSTVRSFVPGDANHDIKPIVSSASFRCSLGSIYSRVAGAVRPETAIPTAALIHPRSVQPEAGPMITEFGNLAASGDLGAQYAPFIPGAGAGLQEDMQLHLPLERLADRRSLLEQLDQQRRRIESTSVSETETLRAQAFDALVKEVSQAFDLRRESADTLARFDTGPLVRPDQIRTQWNNHKHYADHAANLGKLLLLARRLCEQGCGFVTVTTSFVWDMHADVNNAPMQEGMRYVGAPFDHAVSALIDDLQERGLSEKIMLVCCGEMGRTPSLNAAGGRDHWGNLGPLMIYGGGTRGGQVIGQSSHDGGQPASDPIRIPDLMATLYDKLLDVNAVRLDTSLPRPVLDLLGSGKPIAGL
ncbi:MAG: DUF1501 domain-containing protein [Pirellulaceae bacterium]|jgi:hypothetical protein